VLVELHCHSTCSDGSAAASEVGRRAAERAPAVFALTDHDTTAGHADAAIAVPAALRAVELTCSEDGRAVHVLVYDAAGDERWRELETLLATQVAARRERLRAIAARLFRLGIVLDVEPILAAATRDHGRVVGRPDVANALVAQGHATSRDDAFNRWLHDGGPADVPLARLTIADGLAVVRAGAAELVAVDPGGLEDEAYACIRAEDVVLEPQEGHPSSALNRLPGVVAARREEGPLVRITVDVGVHLVALVTRASAERLQLVRGRPVSAVVKAPSVRIVPRRA
jgi:molybdopterin-binding protein